MPARVIDADLLPTATEESVVVFRDWLNEHGVRRRDAHLVIDPGHGSDCTIVVSTAGPTAGSARSSGTCTATTASGRRAA